MPNPQRPRLTPFEQRLRVRKDADKVITFTAPIIVVTSCTPDRAHQTCCINACFLVSSSARCQSPSSHVSPIFHDSCARCQAVRKAPEYAIADGFVPYPHSCTADVGHVGGSNSCPAVRCNKVHVQRWRRHHSRFCPEAHVQHQGRPHLHFESSVRVHRRHTRCVGAYQAF